MSEESISLEELEELIIEYRLINKEPNEDIKNIIIENFNKNQNEFLAYFLFNESGIISFNNIDETKQNIEIRDFIIKCLLTMKNKETFIKKVSENEKISLWSDIMPFLFNNEKDLFNRYFLNSTFPNVKFKAETINGSDFISIFKKENNFRKLKTCGICRYNRLNFTCSNSKHESNNYYMQTFEYSICDLFEEK